MKRSFFILLALVSTVNLVHADQPGRRTAATFTVTGQLKNFKDSILYMNYGPFAGSKTDTVRVTNGTFVFKGAVSEPVPAMIFTPTFHVKIDLYVDNTTINITGNADSMSTVKVKGNTAVDEFETFNQAVMANRQATIALFNEAYNRKMAGDTAEAAKIQAKAEKQYAYEHEIRLNFIKTHPSSYISTRELLQLTNNESLAESRKLYAALDPRIQQSAQGKEVADRIALLSKIETGRQALPFTQSTVDGKTVTLADFRGKYVLLEFWASWCGPCRGENPNLRKQYQLYKDKGLEIVGVSLDHDKDAWVKAIEHDQLPWVHVSDLQGWKNAVSTSYGIMGVPANFLIDPQGKIVAQNLRGEELNKKLQGILH